MKDAVLTTVAVIAIIGILIFVVKNFGKPIKEDTSRTATADPCSIELDTNSIFNGIWIGMPRSAYKHKKESVHYQGDARSGHINWTPEWANDTLVKLLLEMDSEDILGYSDYDLKLSGNRLMGIGVFRDLVKNRYHCDLIEIGDKSQSLECERIGFTYMGDIDGSVVIYDRCHQLKTQMEKNAKTDAARERSKALFN